MRKLAMILFCSLTLLGCVSTSTVTTTESANDAEAYIRAADPRFIAAFNSEDWDTVASFYAEDAVVMKPNAEIARGPAGAREAFGAIAPMRPRLSFSPDRVIQSCDLAFEYGRYEMRMTPPGASTISDRGKYITVWRRTPGGGWKIIGDIENTSLPAPRHVVRGRDGERARGRDGENGKDSLALSPSRPLALSVGARAARPL